MPGSEPVPRDTSVSWKDICLQFSGLSGEYRQGDRLVPPGRHMAAAREVASRSPGKSGQSFTKTQVVVQSRTESGLEDGLRMEEGIRHCTPALFPPSSVIARGSTSLPPSLLWVAKVGMEGENILAVSALLLPSLPMWSASAPINPSITWKLVVRVLYVRLRDVNQGVLFSDGPHALTQSCI